MTTAYDQVIYPNLCHPQTHPDRLAVTANLFGLDPSPPERCHVLEIGCGDGSNLLPLAAAFPQSRFVGFDLAKTRVQAGRENIASLGVANLELVHTDILGFPAEGEPFDYIIAHGVYSWIPAEARDRLLALCRGRLAPHGVAYVSYNCLPGCHVRRMTREIMRFHTRAVQDPAERVRQAVAVCRLIANSIDKPDAYRQLFKDQLEQIQRLRAGHLFHDDLADINDPVYFHEFASHAARHQLQYLAEADFFEMQDDTFTPEARQILGQMNDSRLTREQYLDFVKCRRFRQTLLVHCEALVRHPALPAPIERFHLSSQAQSTGIGTGPDGKPIERFAHPRGALEVGHPLGIRALHILAERWPATVSFPDLFAAALAGGQTEPSDHDAVRGQLLRILLEAYRAGIVDFRRTPVRCALKPSARPVASRFARWQLTRSVTVTTLRGENLRVEDQPGKHLLLLLDGTHSLEELEQCMTEGAPQIGAPGVENNGRLVQRLQELAGFALLES
jgi:SAM-dependent methyltransferase